MKRTPKAFPIFQNPVSTMKAWAAALRAARLSNFLRDVQLDNPTEGQILTYNSVKEYWENRSGIDLSEEEDSDVVASGDFIGTGPDKTLFRKDDNDDGVALVGGESEASSDGGSICVNGNNASTKPGKIVLQPGDSASTDTIQFLDSAGAVRLAMRKDTSSPFNQDYLYIDNDYEFTGRDTTVHSLASGVSTTIGWDVTVDDANMYNSGTKTFTIPVTGVWIVKASIVMDSNTVGTRTGYMLLSGFSNNFPTINQWLAPNIGFAHIDLYYLGELASGITFKFTAFQNSGVALNMSPASGSRNVIAIKLLHAT